jgi:hypothetical protein
MGTKQDRRTFLKIWCNLWNWFGYRLFESFGLCKPDENRRHDKKGEKNE